MAGFKCGRWFNIIERALIKKIKKSFVFRLEYESKDQQPFADASTTLIGMLVFHRLSREQSGLAQLDLQIYRK